MQLPVILPKASSPGLTGMCLSAPGLYQTNTTSPQNTTRSSTELKSCYVQLSQTPSMSGMEQNNKRATNIRTWSIPVYNNTSCTFQTNSVISKHISPMNHGIPTVNRIDPGSLLPIDLRNDEAERTRAAFTLPYKKAATTGMAVSTTVENALSSNIVSKVEVTSDPVESQIICIPMSIPLSENGLSSRLHHTQSGQNQNKRKSNEDETFCNKQQKFQIPENHEPVFPTTRNQKYILPKKVCNTQEVETTNQTLTANTVVCDKKKETGIQVHDKSSLDKTNVPLASHKMTVPNSTESNRCLPTYDATSNELGNNLKPIKKVLDHYLLSKPISLEEARSLISKNKLDLRLKYETTDHDARDLGASASHNVSKMRFGKTEKAHRKTLDKKILVLSNSNEVGVDSNPICTSTALDKQVEQSNLNHKKSVLKEYYKSGKFGNEKGQTFYIISSGNKKKQTHASNEQGPYVVDSVSERKVQTANQVLNKKGTVKSYKINGLVIASRKPTSSQQTRPSQPIQKEANIAKESHQQNTLVFQENNISKSIVTSDKNKKNISNNKPCYNSKLTVAQLLKNKRGEERLETMLKSALNKSCNANTKTDQNKNNETCVNSASCVEISAAKPAENTVSESDNKHSVTEGKHAKHGTILDTTPSAPTDCNKEQELIHRNTPGKSKASQTGMNGQSPRSFSVKLGTKVVVMKRNTTDQSPNPKERKKLPPPKSTNQADKQNGLNNDPGKKERNCSEKEIFVENLCLISTSELKKSVRQENSIPEAQYTTNKSNESCFVESDSGETSPLEDKQHTFSKSLSASILHIWKANGNKFKHSTQLVEIELLSNDNGMFRRWHEFSDYPCIIKFTHDGIIKKMVSGEIKPGFFLVTKTKTKPSGGLNEAYDVFCILSMYPPNLKDLPDNSMAIYIINLSDDGCSKTTGSGDIQDDPLKSLNHTGQCQYGKDGRYNSITDAEMSPRSLSPAFYSKKLQEYFSDLHTTNFYQSTKETKYSDDIDKCRVSSLGKIKGCNSKVEALKKKQKDLLKTCRKFTKNRNKMAIDSNSYNVSTQENTENPDDDNERIDVI